MKPKASLFFLFLILTGCAVVSAAEKKIPDQLWQKVQKDGMVRVIVSLNVPAKAEANLTQDEIVAQRQAIRDAQNQLLKELDGTKYQLFGMAITIAGMALNVGTDALTVLDKSALVSDVTESIAHGLTQ